MTERRVCLAQFAGAHGVRGEAKLKCFTATEAGVAAYGPLMTEDGARRFTFTFLRAPKPGLAIVKAPEIKSREDAAALSGIRLYVLRSALPAVEAADEFYVEDLVGLAVKTDAGRSSGAVAAVHNFGAGDVLELKKGKASVFVPFTLTAVPSVDIVGRIVTIAESALEEIDATRSEADPDYQQDAMREEDA